MKEKEVIRERKLLENKTAIITGGARGIGRGVAIEYAHEGANIVIADINEQGSQETKKILSSFEKQILVVKTDITSESERKRLIKETMNRFGRIDILVNNAAIVNFPNDIHIDPSEKETLRVFDTNYHAHRILSRAIATIMRESKIKGSIIFITSIHAQLVRMQDHYHASKAALEASMREMAVEEFGCYGIRVNAIAPGAINTTENASPKDLRKGHFKDEIPLGRMGLPREIGKAAVFLGSNEFSSYMTASTITVDGGLSQFNWITKQYLNKRKKKS